MLNGIIALLAFAAHPQKDSTVPALDTAFVSGRRMQFGSTGRYHMEWKQTSANTLSLSSFLQQQGVVLKQYGVNGAATISRRGADPQQTQLLWNGLPINHCMLGMPDLYTITLFGNSSIQLTDGGNASLYGSGSVGGTLSMNQNGPVKPGPGATVVLNAGSFGSYTGAADLRYKGKSAWFASQSLANMARNDYRYQNVEGNQWVTQKMAHASGSLYMQRVLAGFRVGNTEVRSIAEYTATVRHLGMLLGSTQEQGTEKDRNTRLMLETDSRLGRWQAVNRIGYTADQIVFLDAVHALDDTSKARVYHAQTEWYYKGKGYQLLTGLDLQDQHGFARQYGGYRHRTYPGQFAAAIIQAGNWTINPSARFEWYEKIPVASLSAERSIVAGLTWKLNVHNTFRRPTLNDLFWEQAGRNLLKPETGTGAETGIHWQGHKGRLKQQLMATVYTRQLQHPIIWMPSGSVWRAVNLYQGQYAGLQLQEAMQWTAGRQTWQLQASAEYVHARMVAQKGETPVNRLFIPAISGAASISWTRNLGNIGLQCQGFGSRYTTTDNTGELPAFALFNASCGQKWKLRGKSELEGSLECFNILNTEWQSIPGKPMPGRSFRASIKYNFN